MKKGEYTECYIAFLDMLGFKNLINRCTCKEICEVFDEIKKPFQSASLQGNVFIPKESVEALNIKVMSDSICFYIDINCKNSLLTLLMSCAVFQLRLLKLSIPVLLRGAVVRGNMYAERDVTFGPGLTQAYLMEEYNAKYPRIILTNDLRNFARKEDESIVNEAIKQNVISQDHDAFYMLNCIQMLSRDEIKAFERFQQNIKKILDTTTDESIREKYLYLENVIKDII